MKKVLALVLAVMMLTTLAVAWDNKGNDKKYYRHTVTPAGSVDVNKKTGISTNVTYATVYGNNDAKAVDYVLKVDENGDTKMDSGEEYGINLASSVNPSDGLTDDEYNQAVLDKMGVQDMLFRTITNENYTVTNLKVTTGRNVVSGVSISDSDEAVKVNFVKDLNNTGSVEFNLSFTLKGKGKMILKNTTGYCGETEEDMYNAYMDLTGKSRKKKGQTATIPTVRFKMSGTVGYGKVTVSLGNEYDEDMEDLDGQEAGWKLNGNGKPLDGTTADRQNDKGEAVPQLVNFKDDVIKFSQGDKNGGDFMNITRNAGSYVADAVLTEHYPELTMEARVYDGDTLYLYCKNTPDNDYLARLATVDGDIDFYFFEQSSPRHVTLNSNAKLVFEDTEEGDYLYEYNNGKIRQVGEYSDDDGCIVLKTRKLGQYITCGHELVEMETIGSDDIENPDTGANDVVGIAAALAAVALVSAAAVSLKK